MDVGRTPGIGVVLPGIRARTNSQEAIDTVFICHTTANAEEIRIERPRPLITFVKVAASGIGLPDLQEGVRHGLPTLVEHSSGNNDALADGLAAGRGITCEIGVLWGDGADSGTRPRQFRESERHIDKRKCRRATARGLICLI